MKDSILFLQILDTAEEALTFCEGQTSASLKTNRMLLLALTEMVEIIGGMASKISEARRSQYPQIPWRAIIDMRNHLIHGYFDVDVDQVWSTLVKDLPSLIAELQKIVPNNRAE